MNDRLSILKPWRLPLVPVATALALALLSLTPSMLPRPALFQGVLCALAALLGYGFGALIGWLFEAGRGEAGPRRAGRIFWLVASVLGIGGLVAYRIWQTQQAQQLGMLVPALAELLLVPVVSVVLFGLLLIACRAVRTAGRWLQGKVGRGLPRRAATVLVVLVLAFALVLLGNRGVVQRVTAALDSVYLEVNDDFLTELDPPAVPELSAGPGSAVSWDELGRQGRLFVENAPSAGQVAAFSGTNAAQPIRIYIGAGGEVGVQPAAQAALAVQELERTGAFDRAVLNVATGTGRGWVNENQIQALEYMWGGDTATVSMQYSYLPSWMSFLMDSSRAQEAGRLLFDAVYAHWIELPADERPKLVVSGESLGSFGAEAAFSGAQDFATRTYGALFVGPAAGNQLWNQFTAERDAGSPQHLPVYQDGQTVRFSSDGVNWSGADDWEGSRIGYLQHSNDPISWGDASVLTQRPDWLRSGQRAANIPDAMIWVPVITGLQLVLDQVAPGVPDGQGHEFGQVPVRAWAQILPPEGWQQADTERLVQLLAEAEPAR